MEPTAALDIIVAAFKAGPSVVLAGVIWFLWKELKAEREAHMATLKSQAADKEKTIGDYHEFTEVLKDLTDAIHTQRRP